MDSTDPSSGDPDGHIKSSGFLTLKETGQLDFPFESALPSRRASLPRHPSGADILPSTLKMVASRTAKVECSVQSG